MNLRDYLKMTDARYRGQWKKHNEELKYLLAELDIDLYSRDSI